MTVTDVLALHDVPAAFGVAFGVAFEDATLFSASVRDTLLLGQPRLLVLDDPMSDSTSRPRTRPQRRVRAAFAAATCLLVACGPTLTRTC